MWLWRVEQLLTLLFGWENVEVYCFFIKLGMVWVVACAKSWSFRYHR